jgi:hypothetical protein
LFTVAIEQGKPRAAMGLALRTMTALGLRVAVDEVAAGYTEDDRALDINAVIERARALRRVVVPADDHSGGVGKKSHRSRLKPTSPSRG